MLKLDGAYQFDKFKLIDLNKKKVINIFGYETIFIKHYAQILRIECLVLV